MSILLPSNVGGKPGYTGSKPSWGCITPATDVIDECADFAVASNIVLEIQGTRFKQTAEEDCFDGGVSQGKKCGPATCEFPIGFTSLTSTNIPTSSDDLETDYAFHYTWTETSALGQGANCGTITYYYAIVLVVSGLPTDASRFLSLTQYTWDQVMDRYYDDGNNETSDPVERTLFSLVLPCSTLGTETEVTLSNSGYGWPSYSPYSFFSNCCSVLNPIAKVYFQ